MSAQSLSFVRNGWYCAAFSSELAASPVGRTFLGQPVVMFRKPDGVAVAMSGVCPHRFAPLHQGKLDDGILSCPYHGLAFDSTGACVRNPHGSGRIPERSTLTTYPLIERQGVAWIWLGDPAAATAETIVDLQLVGDADHPRVTGYMNMNVGYRLVIDNLLDLNHAPYLHGGTLSPKGTTRKTWWDRGHHSAASHYLMRDVETPASQRLWFDAPRGDYHVTMDWTAPGTLRQHIAMTHVDASIASGAQTKGAHLITPESATSTHYFWLMTRNRCVDDRDADANLKALIDHAFLNEDGPMMEACQRNMRGREFNDLKPIFLETDAAAGHARAVLTKLSSAEATEPSKAGI